MSIKKLIEKARQLKRNEQLSEAKNSYQVVLKEVPKLFFIRQELGELLEKQGKLKDAIWEYRQAFDAKPNSSWLAYKLGIAFVKQGNIEEALEYLEKATEIDPKVWKYHNSLGEILLRENRVEEAVEYFQKAIELNPSIGASYKNLGLAFSQQKKLEAANQNFQKAVDLDPRLRYEVRRCKIKIGKDAQRTTGQDYFLPYTLEYDFQSILDIGTGTDTYIVNFFIENGKTVFSIDVEKQNNYQHKNFYFIKGNFLQYPFSRKFDAVWASHVLEHVQDTGAFLNKIYDLLNENGILFCIVPPHKTKIVGGHLTIGWNIGILMYNLIISGFDVKNGRFKKQGYNIAAFVQKRKSRKLPDNLLFDKGDIEKLADFWPDKEYFKQDFEGNISEWNWFSY